MLDDTQKEIRTFFSWQSDSPSSTNSSAIRNALKEAAKSLEQKHPKLKIVLDEATRDTSGSPNIADKIWEKIDAVQIYIADITTVTPEGSPRPSANPNVLIELGYAISQIGWDRIILLFNEAQGKFPGDLPFDIVQNRVAKYSISLSEKDDSKKKNLKSLMETAIQAVLEKNPKTPEQLRGLSPERVQHERDVESLKWLLSQIHIPTVDDHIQGLPRYIRDKIFWFWETFKGVVTNSLFHLYDPILEQAVCKLYDSWSTTLSFYGRYHDAPGGATYVFANPGDAPLDAEQEADWNAIKQGAADMHQALQDILARVRAAYLEVNVNQTNAKAWDDYRAFQKD